MDIVYIGSHGRSGSTLLDRLIGLGKNAVSLGEMRNIWRVLGDDDDFLCGCGLHHADCPFWKPVFADAFSLPPNEQRLRALSAAITRIDKKTEVVPAHDADFRSWVEAQLAPFCDLITNLYQAIADREDGLLVDSSKYSWYARWMQQQPSFAVHCLHLVRDSRGVAYSRTRTKKRTDSRQDRQMGRFSPFHTCRWWDKDNADLERLGGTCVSYVRGRYEDLIGHPKRFIARAMQKLGVSAGIEAAPVQKGSAEVGISHTAFGNPRRMEQGTVSIREDDRWKQHLSWPHFALVTSLTHSRLRRYGYDLWP